MGEAQFFSGQCHLETKVCPPVCIALLEVPAVGTLWTSGEEELWGAEGTRRGLSEWGGGMLKVGLCMPWPSKRP